MSGLYDDEMVEAGVKILMQPRMHTNQSGDKQRYDLRAVLDAIAPLIAARAYAAGYTDGVAWDGWVPSPEDAAAAATEWLKEAQA